MKKNKNGFSLVELLVAIAIFITFAGSASSAILGSYRLSRRGEENFQASAIAAEGIEAVRSVRNNSWDNLVDGTYGLTLGPENSGMLMWLTMNDDVSGNGQALEDNSGNGHTGLTSYGSNGTGMDCSVSGNENFGCQLDGVDDDITINDGSAFSVNSFSISAWIYRSVDTGGSEYFFDTREADNDGIRFNVDGSTDYLECSYNEFDSTDVTQNYTIPVGSWTHVVCTSNGSELKTYVNGNINATISISGSISETAANTSIGDRNTTSGGNWNGTLDDVRFYNDTLSDTQVSSIYNGTEKTIWQLTSSPDLVGNYTRTIEITSMERDANDDISGEYTGILNPVGYWPMDEGSGTSTTYDNSGNGYDGTMNGSMTEDDWVSGYKGSSLEFDGSNDYISVSDNADLSPTAAFSYFAWVNQDSLNSDEAIGAKWTYSSDGGWALVVPGTGGFLRAFIADSAGDIGNNYGTTYSAVFSANTWNHIGVVYDGSGSTNADKLKIYLNGVEQNLDFTGTIPATTRDTNADLRIGDFQNLSRFWTGKIDDVRFYNHALSQFNIDELYQSSGPSANVAHWKLDESGSGDGVTIVDSINGYNGVTADGDDNTGMTCGGAGQIDTACEFDGNAKPNGDYIKVENIAGLPTGDFTYSVWIKPDTLSSFNQIIHTRSPGNADEFTFWLDSSGRVTVRTNTGNNFTTTNAVSAGLWQNVAVTRSGSTISVYIDGSLDPTSGSDGTALVYDGDECLHIGADFDSSCDSSTPDINDFFDGLIDDVRIYDYALSESEINGVISGYTPPVISTKRITSTVTWTLLNGQQESTTLTSYLTNWQLVNGTAQ